MSNDKNKEKQVLSEIKSLISDLIEMDEGDNNTKNKEKSFGRLAFERFVSNFLSVKVWLFIIPITLSAGFLWWAVDIISDTTILVQSSLDSSANIVEVTKSGMEAIKSVFSSWMKFTGSLVVTIVGVREVWKVAKIKEKTKDKDRAERERNKERK